MMVHFLLLFFLLLFWLFANIIISQIILWISNPKKNYIYSYNFLQADYFDKIKYLYNAKWIFEKSLVCLILNIFLRIDFVINLFKLKRIEKEYSYNKILEIIIFIYFIIELILFIFYKSINFYFDAFIASIFIWRIVSILITTLKNFIVLINRKKLESFFRTFVFLIINFFELIICYSFLYSNSIFSIYNNKKSDLIFKTLSKFVDWSIPENNNFCLIQKVLIFSQIIIFLFCISLFLANLINMDNYKNKNKT